MKDIKFYIGPMTQNIIDAVIEFAEENNQRFGFVATRRQIDYDGGYVGYNTHNFTRYIKSKTNKVLICRDHSGQGQGKNSKASMYDTMTSLYWDAIEDMDIIHIDPFKNEINDYTHCLRETLNHIFYVNTLSPNSFFEIGTEQAIKPYDALYLYTFLNDLQKDLGPLFNRIKYAVIQSGTNLEETKNTGIFNLNRLKNMINVCNDFGVLSKEHNGDYLTNEEIKIRFDNGLNAINIAPEFGVIETMVLLDHINNNTVFEKIYKICLNGEKWKKWVDLTYFKPSQEKTKLIEICGHYHNTAIREIINMDDNIIKNQIKEKIKLYNKWIVK